MKINEINEKEIDVSNNLAFQGSVSTITTTSTTLVFTGTGVILTPKTSGKLRIALNAYVKNNTLNDGIAVNINYAMGTTLTVAGAAATGTRISTTPIEYITLTSAQVSIVNVAFEITGFTIGTSYTFQPVFEAITGGIASFTQSAIWVEEITRDLII